MDNEIQPVGFTDDLDNIEETDPADWFIGIMWAIFTVSLVMLKQDGVIFDLIAVLIK